MYIIAFMIVVLISSAVMYRLITRQIMKQTEKADSQTRQLTEIHSLVNSNLTEVKADLAIALDRIQILETLLTKSR